MTVRRWAPPGLKPAPARVRARPPNFADCLGRSGRVLPGKALNRQRQFDGIHECDQRRHARARQDRNHREHHPYRCDRCCPRAGGAGRVEEPCHTAAKRGSPQGGAGDDGDRRGPGACSNRRCEQGRGVLAGRPRSGDDVVIAGGFPIEVDAAGEPAHRGMQPSNGSCDGLQQLQPVVVPREVRVLVHDHLIERRIVQPLDQGPADDDERAAESDCAGARKTFRDPQLGRAARARARHRPQRQLPFTDGVEGR